MYISFFKPFYYVFPSKWSPKDFQYKPDKEKVKNNFSHIIEGLWSE